MNCDNEDSQKWGSHQRLFRQSSAILLSSSSATSESMPKSGPGAVIVDGIPLLVMDVMVSQVGEFSSNLGHGHGQCVGALSVSGVYRGHPTA